MILYIGIAGGLTALSKMPACNILVSLVANETLHMNHVRADYAWIYMYIAELVTNVQYVCVYERVN